MLSNPKCVLNDKDINGGINAFALDSFFSQAYVLLNVQIISLLTQDEVEAVIAHEMCHIAHGHARVLTFVQGMTIGVTAPIAFLLSAILCLFRGVEHFRRDLIMFNSFALVALFPLTSIFVLWLTRRWEFSADRCAANLIGRQQYVQVLRCLHGSLSPAHLLSRSTLSAGDRLKRILQPILALSHPSLVQRINALQEGGS